MYTELSTTLNFLKKRPFDVGEASDEDVKAREVHEKADETFVFWRRASIENCTALLKLYFHNLNLWDLQDVLERIPMLNTSDMGNTGNHLLVIINIKIHKVLGHRFLVLDSAGKGFQTFSCIISGQRTSLC